MNRIAQIALLAFTILSHPVICNSGTMEPEEIYKIYNKVLSSSSTFGAADEYLSSSNLTNRQKYIEKLESKGQQESDIHVKLHKRTMRRMSCIKNLQQIDKSKTNNQAIVIYSFEDVCSLELKKNNPEKYKDMIISNVLEVHFINENGWKIDMSFPRPNKPKVVKEVIKP